MSCQNNYILGYIVLRVIKYQLLQGVIAAFFILIIKKDLTAFLSALCGILIALIPTLVYAKVVISKNIDDIHATYRKHKLAIGLKFLSNAMCFLVVFLLYKNVNVLMLFITYIISLSGYWTSIISSRATK